MRVIVGISGATGAIFGIRILQGRVATYLILSKWRQRTIEHETTMSVEAVDEDDG